MCFLVVTEHMNLQCITMSLWIITLLTSLLKPMHKFASICVWLFFGWTPTKFVIIEVLPLFFRELWVILANSFKKKFYKIRPESIHIWFGETQCTSLSYPQPRTFAWGLWLIVQWEPGCQHIELSHVITNQQSSFQCLDGASGFTMLFICVLCPINSEVT